MKIPGKGLPSLGKSKGTRQQPSWREMLQLCPARNPNLDWTDDDGKVVLLIRHDMGTNWKTRFLRLFVSLPEDRRVSLDAIGSDVWHLIDGKNTLGQIAKELAVKYKLSSREAELSLQQYFKELGRRGYIGFIKENDEK
jgi:hypothetical protein